MPAAEREKLGRAVGVLTAVLGGDALGAYLYGSATRGGLRVASDLDVLAVARRRTTLEERRRLADGLPSLLARTAAAGDARRNVELTIVVRDDVVPWRYPPRLDFLYGSWLDDAFRAGDRDEAAEDWRGLGPSIRPCAERLVTEIRRAAVPS